VAIDGSLFKPLPTKRSFDEISDQIKDLIYAKTLKPGDKLPAERELAVHFGTGRMAVREALRILEQSGLVYIKQGSEGGAFIKDTDTSIAVKSIHDLIRRSKFTIEDVIEVRMGLEKLVLEAAFDKITKTDLYKLRKRIDEAEAIIHGETRGDKPLDFVLLGETYADFHLILARATKNPVFEIIVDCLMNVSHSVVHQKSIPSERFEKHLEFHKAIYNLLKNKNSTLARKTFEELRKKAENHFFHGNIRKKSTKVKIKNLLL
jgi:GntR family transcriptional regulator, transcriptional repressor for pyruvate dehydrogenase complex